jgi:blocked-early-in-transport protein 1
MPPTIPKKRTHKEQFTNHIPRFGRNDARDDLFSSYNRSASPSKSKQKPRSPYGAGAGYGYSPSASDTSFSAYPGAHPSSSNGNLYPSNSGYGLGGGGNSSEATFRAATPNSRGQYSSAVLDELESQNENEHVGMLTSKVKQLKDVRSLGPFPHPQSSGGCNWLTTSIFACCS